MKKIHAVVALLLVVTLYAQPKGRPSPPIRTNNAEQGVRMAMEQLANERRTFERDLETLKVLREADSALTDPMQPHAAISKARDGVKKAKQLATDFTVMQEIIKSERELDAAEKSPMGADFGRLRVTLRGALAAESRVVVRNALRLQEETLAWLKVQQLISEHVRVLSEITGDSLRSAAAE